MEKLSKEEIGQFDFIIRNLNVAIKNSLLYTPHHPLFRSAIKNFKTSLETWFCHQDEIELGVSPDNVLLKSSYIKEKDENYKEVADYLHRRGIVALSISKYISINELIEFFTFIKNDVTTVRKKGGILKNIPSTPHLKIREIDYSVLLVGTEEAITDEEKDIWQSLSRITEEAKVSRLPESKVEFLVDFLKNPKKSAHVLNVIYKQAVAKLKDRLVVENIRRSIARVTRYFEKYPSEDIKDLRNSLKDIIVRLDPNLVVHIFERTAVDGKSFSLAKEITKGLSDDIIADFMVSLMTGEDRFNENIVKVFDKLIPEKSKVGNLVPMTADKLFERNLLDKNALSKLKLSIKEIFKVFPHNDFMSQMYKITVGAFASREVDALADAEELSSLKKEYMEFLREKNLREEKTRLLLNIIWFENDPAEFKKFSQELVSNFGRILDSRDTRSLREILEFFIERIRPEQKKDEKIDLEVKKILDKVNDKEVIDKIISFVPEADSKELEDITYILVKTKANSAISLLDAFTLQKHSLGRVKFGSILSKMGKEISQEICNRLEKIEDIHFSIIKDLFKILKAADSERAHVMAKKLIWHKNIGVRLTALEGFDPKNEAERDSVFKIFKKVKNNEIQSKALTILVKTKNKDIIEKVFKSIKKRFFKKKPLLRFVELCGNFKVQESLPYLKKIFIRRPLFNIRSDDELRIASLVNSARINTTEARTLIEKGLNDRSESVRKMCKIMMDLDRNV